MYRQYENPYELQKQLEELKEEYRATTDEDRLIDLAYDIAELEERINFAWQDDEYNESY